MEDTDTPPISPSDDYEDVVKVYPFYFPSFTGGFFLHLFISLKITILQVAQLKKTSVM